MYYAGIGSRKTPPEVLKEMSAIAERLSSLGFTLRSGGADGADSLFEQGCDKANGRKEVFLPWKGFNGRDSKLFEQSPQAVYLASEAHPSWHSCSQGVKKMHARNVHQVLGHYQEYGGFTKPSSFVICWTPDGCEHTSTRKRETGGTGQAITIASNNNVPVFNLFNPDAVARMDALIDSLQLESVQLDQKPVADLAAEQVKPAIKFKF